jgi:hypothetical protein
VCPQSLAWGRSRFFGRDEERGFVWGQTFKGDSGSPWNQSGLQVERPLPRGRSYPSAGVEGQLGAEPGRGARAHPLLECPTTVPPAFAPVTSAAAGSPGRGGGGVLGVHSRQSQRPFSPPAARCGRSTPRLIRVPGVGVAAPGSHHHPFSPALGGRAQWEHSCSRGRAQP